MAGRAGAEVREGIVVEIIQRREGATLAWVEVQGRRERAVCYPALTGAIEPGDRVALNTTAVTLGLGTGGHHFVTAVWGRTADLEGPGHIMKVRYTPSQVRVLAVEEEESPYHHALSVIPDLAGLPVAACGLHSQLPVVAAAIKAACPRARVAYVMTDGAALPAAVSDVLARLRKSGLVDTVITAGHAFGGDLEAVTVHSALAAAKVAARADAVIVAMGPGVVGTGTPLGSTALEQALVLDAACDLGGRGVPVIRVSFADARERHRGISHHALTCLTRFVHHRLTVPLPALSRHEWRARLEEQTAGLRACGHRIRWRDGAEALARAERLLAREGIRVTSMGRSAREDPAFFEAAAAAGEEAAGLLERPGPPQEGAAR